MHQIAPSAPALIPSLLHLAIGGDAAAARRIYDCMSPSLLKAARRRAPKLPKDLHEEIVSETWNLVFARGSEPFDRAAVEDSAYLHSVLRNAAEVVKANNRAPGTRSRLQGNSEKRPQLSQSLVLDPDAGSEACEERFAEYEVQLTARLDVFVALGKLSPLARTAAIFILENGSTLTEAAASASLTRQTLARHFAALRIAA